MTPLLAGLEESEDFRNALEIARLSRHGRRAPGHRVAKLALPLRTLPRSSKRHWPAQSWPPPGSFPRHGIPGWQAHTQQTSHCHRAWSRRCTGSNRAYSCSPSSNEQPNFPNRVASSDAFLACRPNAVKQQCANRLLPSSATDRFRPRQLLRMESKEIMLAASCRGNQDASPPCTALGSRTALYSFAGLCQNKRTLGGSRPNPRGTRRGEGCRGAGRSTASRPRVVQTRSQGRGRDHDEARGWWTRTDPDR